MDKNPVSGVLNFLCLPQKNWMLRTLIVVLFLHFSTLVFSQSKTEVNFDVTLLSRHFWRGAQLGDAPAIEPNVTFINNNMSFSVWAAQTFNNSYAEIDIIPAYSFGNFTTTIYDYYNPVPGADNNYFSFSGENNRHSGEIAIGYNGQGIVPLKVMTGTFMYGDKNPETKKAFYSTYIEMAYPFAVKMVDIELHAGFTPAKGYYAESFSFVNTGVVLKTDVKLSSYLKMPFMFSGLYNPDTSKAFFIFGIGISKI